MIDGISIIVPVYNSASTIERCARSLMALSPAALELIFVDDASQDESVEILTRLAKLPESQGLMRIVSLSKNGGPGGARNVGMRAAKGRWCAFVDADDWVEPGYLQPLIEHGLAAGDFVISGIEYNHKDGKGDGYRLFQQNILQTNAMSPQDMLCVIMYSYPVAKLFDLELIREFGLEFPSTLIHEDTLFVLRYLRHAKKVVFSSRAQYHYMLMTDNSLTKRLYRPEEYRRLADLFRAEWELFFRFFDVKPLALRSAIQRYGLSQLLQAVYSQYKYGDVSRESRLDNIVAVRAARHHFDKYYKPSCLRNRMMLFFLLRLPVSFCDFLATFVLSK